MLFNCHPYVDFYNKFNSKESFKSITINGKQVNQCGKTVVFDSNLLRILLLMTNKGYTFTIGTTASNHRCDKGQHPKGNAIDINTVNGQLIGSTPFKGTIKAFYIELANLLQNENGHGGLGQQQCFYSRSFIRSMETKYPNVNFFDDDCDHIHVDTR